MCPKKAASVMAWWSLCFSIFWYHINLLTLNSKNNGATLVLFKRSKWVMAR